MSTEPLPTMLDVRKAAVRGSDISGVLKPLDLQGFRPLLAADDGEVCVVLKFARDEENRYLIQVAIEANIVVTCQRCLEPMPERLSSTSTLAVVWTDEQAAHLPKDLDPLIVEDQACNLHSLVEEELILSLPPFSYHDTEDCKKSIKAFSDPVAEETDRTKPNPFNVLGILKPGNKH